MSERDESVGRDRRRHIRVQISVAAKLEIGARPAVDCQVYNMSVGGALIEEEQGARLGERIVLHIEGFGPVTGHVARVTSTVIALAFEERNSAALAEFIERRRMRSAAAPAAATTPPGEP